MEYGEKELNFASTHLTDWRRRLKFLYKSDFPYGEKSPPETHLRPLTQLRTKPPAKRSGTKPRARAEEEGAKLTAKRVEEG